jgi:hypothetical protein
LQVLVRDPQVLVTSLDLHLAEMEIVQLAPQLGHVRRRGSGRRRRDGFRERLGVSGARSAARR